MKNGPGMTVEGAGLGFFCVRNSRKVRNGKGAGQAGHTKTYTFLEDGGGELGSSDKTMKPGKLGSSPGQFRENVWEKSKRGG